MLQRRAFPFIHSHLLRECALLPQSAQRLPFSPPLVRMQDVAQATGIILDPVYSGKAVHAMLGEMRRDPQAWAGRRVLFVHTGGLLGVYDKADQLQTLLQKDEGRVTRMQVSSA